MIKKNNVLFSEGKVEQNVPYHSKMPFLRRVMACNEIFSDCDIHVAVHHIDNIKDQIKDYCEQHTHDVDEINLIIGNNNGEGLKYKIITEGIEKIVDSPQSIFIPKGIKHSAIALKGSGIFICIVMKGKMN